MSVYSNMKVKFIQYFNGFLKEVIEIKSLFWRFFYENIYKIEQ